MKHGSQATTVDTWCERSLLHLGSAGQGNWCGVGDSVVTEGLLLEETRMPGFELLQLLGGLLLLRVCVVAGITLGAIFQGVG